MFRAINILHGGVTVMKGLNNDERGRALATMWAEFDDPVCRTGDSKRFDQHVDETSLRAENSYYLRCYAESADTTELSELLEMMIENTIYVRDEDGLIRLKSTMRMSGDMTTGGGNTFITSGAVWLALQRFRGRWYRCFVDGDDFGVICSRKHLHRLELLISTFAECGQELVLEEYVDTLEHIVFCQTQPINIGTHYRMVRNPTVAMSKDTLSLRNTESEGAWNYYRAAVAGCGLALCDGVPIMSAFYGYLSSNVVPTRDNLPSGMWYMAQGMQYHASAITPEARVSFWRAFNILPDLQVAIERQYDDRELVYADHPEGNCDYETNHLVLQT
jgi:hypothetical protein